MFVMATTVKMILIISASLPSNWDEDNEADDNIDNNDEEEVGDDNDNKPDNQRSSCPQPRYSDRQEDTATSPSEDLNISL